MTDAALLDARPATAPDAFAVRHERAEDASAVDALIAAAFGPGRHAKTAERVREGAALRPDLCFCAWRDGELAGAVRLWSVAVGGAPTVFLGPIAVAAHLRGRGIAARLVEAACAAATVAGDVLVVLVGDAARFGPMGFDLVPPGRIRLPGPVDGRRLLQRALDAAAASGIAGEMTGPSR